jgi:hypothetical protein
MSDHVHQDISPVTIDMMENCFKHLWGAQPYADEIVLHLHPAMAGYAKELASLLHQAQDVVYKMCDIEDEE